MKSITGMAHVTGEVLDVIRTTTTASLPLKLKDIGCYRTEFQLTDWWISRLWRRSGSAIGDKSPL